MAKGSIASPRVHGDRRNEIDADIAAERASSFAVSPLVKGECLVGPIKRADPGLQRDFADFFDQHLSLAMPEPVYLQAAELRARFGLRTPDALHLAGARHHRCDVLWTNDDRLAVASHELARNVLGAPPGETVSDSAAKE